MKQREKRLLKVVVAVALLGGAFIGWDFFSKKHSLLTAERGRLDTEWIKIETLFEEKELWEARAEWLKNNQPTYGSTGQIDQDIFRKAENPDVDGVTTTPRSPLPSLQTLHYTQAGIALIAEGKHEDVFRWLYNLKRTENFCVIRNLKISPHKKDSAKITCQFELLRWYAPKTQP